MSELKEKKVSVAELYNDQEIDKNPKKQNKSKNKSKTIDSKSKK